MPPTSANGMLLNTSSACRTDPNVANRRRKISASASGTTSAQARRGTLLVLELAAPGQRGSRRAADLGIGHLGFASSTKPTRSRPRRWPAPRVALPILAVDLHRAAVDALELASASAARCCHRAA
jgi:hypothetical protein